MLTAHPGWADLPAVRDGVVWVLDGPAYYNRPGPHVPHGVDFDVTPAEAAHSPG